MRDMGEPPHKILNYNRVVDMITERGGRSQGLLRTAAEVAKVANGEDNAAKPHFA